MVYTFIHVHNIVNMELGKSPCTSTCNRYTTSVIMAPGVAYDLGLAPLGICTSFRLVSHCNRLGQDQRSHPQGLHALHERASVAYQIPMVHAQKCALTTRGPELQDYSTKGCINVSDYSPVGSAIAESWNKYVHMIKWKEAQMDDFHSLLQPEG